MVFLEIMDAHVRKFPERCAVCLNYREQALTYRMLWENSGKVYAWLKKNRIGKEDMVLIYMPRDPRVYVYVLGVMRAGAAFTVVDSTSPKERADFIGKDSGAVTFLTQDLYEDILKEEPLEGYEDRDPHDAAFAVYTSGTTGTPKGVLHEYGNFDLQVRYEQTAEAEQEERFAYVLPIGFVVFLMDLTHRFTCGNTIYMVTPDIFRNLNRFREFLESEKIESVTLPPSMFKRFRDLPRSLKKVKVLAEPANGLYTDQVTITNTYAQSETYFTIATMVLDRKYDKAPVGKNPVGLELKILDDDGHPLEKNITGEICFRNEFFRGYIHLKEQTEYAFRNGIYHTGDLGYLNDDGNLVISGRKDDMIKINGNRIEPAEIEAAGKRILGVDQAVAKGFTEDHDRSFVALYYVRNEGMGKLSKEDEAECIRKFSEILPEYMVPAYLIEIDRIPTVPNGKTDRKALPEPVAENYKAVYAEPQGEFERKLCRVIGQVLGVEKVGRNDDFYALGGDSLKSMEVVTGMDLPALSTTDLFRGRVISRISALYQAKKDEKINWENANEEAKKNEYPLTFEMKRFFDLQLSRPKSTMSVNKYLTCFPLEKVDTERFRNALHTVIHHFSVFGTIITCNDQCEFVLKYDPEKVKEAAYYEIREADLSGFLASKERYFQLLNEPFFDLALIKTETHLYFLNQNHHIAFDGTCNLLLSEAIAAAYRGEPLRPDTWYLYLDRLQKQHTAAYEAELDRYFNHTFGQKAYRRNFEPAMKAKLPGLEGLQPQLFPFSVDELKKASEKLGGTPGVVSFAAVLLAFAGCTGSLDIIGLMQYNNRDDLLSNNTFGLLARSLPVAIELGKLNAVHDLIDALKIKITEGMAYDCMEKLIGNDTPFDPECLTYVYEGVLTGIGELEQLGGRQEFLPPPHDAPRDFSILFIENGNELIAMTGCREQYYQKDLAQKFQKTYVSILCELVSEKDAGSILISRYLASEYVKQP